MSNAFSGQGLGKHNAGISQALKPSLKFDNTGFGHDKAADFNDHWWERVFNEAANNLDVNKNNEEVKVRTKDPDSVEVLIFLFRSNCIYFIFFYIF